MLSEPVHETNVQLFFSSQINDLTMAMSAEEAIQRARAIAARLSGVDSNGNAAAAVASLGASPGSSNTSAATGKRKRWGVAPDEDDATISKRPAAAATAGPTAPTKVEKRLWVSSTRSEKPPSHFVAYLTPRLPDVIEQIRKNDPKFKCRLDGRGATDKPPMPGLPLEPLHMILEASSESVLAAAETEMEKLFSEAEEAALEDANDPSSTALTLANMTKEELIAVTEQRAQLIEETFTIPNGVVGFIVSNVMTREMKSINPEIPFALTPYPISLFFFTDWSWRREYYLHAISDGMSCSASKGKRTSTGCHRTPGPTASSQ